MIVMVVVIVMVIVMAGGWRGAHILDDRAQTPRLCVGSRSVEQNEQAEQESGHVMDDPVMTNKRQVKAAKL